MKRPKALWRREDGQSMVELALVMPMLLLLVLGVVDLGLGFKTYIGLTNAAREGVRWVSIYPCDVAGAEGRMSVEASNLSLVRAEDAPIGTNGYTITWLPSQSCYAAGEQVEATIAYEYELLFGIVPGLDSVPFSAHATMVVLYDPSE